MIGCFAAFGFSNKWKNPPPAEKRDKPSGMFRFSKMKSEKGKKQKG